MAVVTADLNLEQGVLKSLTNGDEVDGQHTVEDVSSASKDNLGGGGVLPSVKDVDLDDVVAKTTDAAAEALLLHLETNGELDIVPPTELNGESQEAAELTSTFNGANGDSVTLPALSAKADAIQDILPEPSLEAMPTNDKEPFNDASADNNSSEPELTSIEAQPGANVDPTVKDDLTNVTESDEPGHVAALALSPQEPAEANKEVEVESTSTPSIPSTNGVDTHNEANHTESASRAEDSLDVSASASLSEDTTAETPTVVTEAAIASPSKLEGSEAVPEPVSAPEQELEHVKPVSHEDTTPSVEAVPVSMSESHTHDIPAEATLEKASPIEEITVPDAAPVAPEQGEAQAPIISEVTSLTSHQPDTAVQAIETPAEESSIPDVQGPVETPSEAPETGVQDKVVNEEIGKALDEMDQAEHAPVISDEEKSAPSAVEETSVVEAHDAPVVEEVKHEEVAPEKPIVEEVAPVQEDAATAPKATALHDATPQVADAQAETITPIVKDNIPAMEDPSPVAEIVATEPAPVVDEAPIPVTAPAIEETKPIEPEASATHADIPVVEAPVVDEAPVKDAEAPIVEETATVVEDTPAVENPKAVETEAPVTPADIPSVEALAVKEEVSVKDTETPTVDETAPVAEDAPGPGVSTSPVVEEVTATEIEAPTPVEEVPAPKVEAEEEEVLAEVTATHTEVPVAEDKVVETEVPIVEDTSAPEVEVAVAEEPASGVQVPAVEAEDIVEPEQTAIEAPAPVPVEDIEKVEAVTAPTTETPSVAEAEAIAENKAVEGSSVPEVQEKEAEKDVSGEVEVNEALVSAKDDVVILEHPDVAHTKETPDVAVNAVVDEPLAVKEEVIPQEIAKEEVTPVVEESSVAEKAEVDAEVVTEAAEKPVEPEDVKAEEEVVSLTHDEPEPTASESVEEPVVETKEVHQEESAPNVDIDEPASIATVVVPVDESIITPNEVQEISKPADEPATETAHVDIQEAVVEEPAPAVTHDTIESSEEALPIPSDATVSASVEDTTPEASLETVDAPNTIAAEVSSTAPPAVEEESIPEAAAIEVHTLVAESVPDIPEQPEDSPVKTEEEPHVEAETSQAQVEIEEREVNPIVDEVPNVVAQPNVTASEEGAPVIEAAIVEAEVAEDKTEVNGLPAIPLPIDEVAEAVPEVVQHVSDEPAVEAHTVIEPPVPTAAEDIIVPAEQPDEKVQEKEVEAESNDNAPTSDSPDVMDESSITSPPPVEEVLAVVEPVEPAPPSTSALSNEEHPHTVDDAPVSLPETTSSQEPLETTLPESVVAEIPVSDEVPVPEETAKIPAEEHTTSDAGTDDVKHHDVEADVVEKKADESIVLEEVHPPATEEPTPSVEAEHLEKNIDEPVETEPVQPASIETTTAIDETTPAPEQPSPMIHNNIHLTHVEEAAPVQEAEETLVSTNFSLPPEAESTSKEIPEPSSTGKDLELEFNAVEDDVQLHSESQPAEPSPVPSDGLLTPASGAEIERPKSPWTPSFQVTTVGRGVSSDEDEIPTPDLDPVEDVPVVEPSVNETAMAETILEVPQVVTPDDEKENIVETSALPIGDEVLQSDADNASLETPPAEIARPWTPSYSVHSQGSPLLVATDLEQDVPADTPIEASHEQTEDEPELPDMEFASNEEAPKVASLAVIADKTTEEIEAVEQPNLIDAEASEEKISLTNNSMPIANDTPVDEISTVTNVPAVVEDMKVHIRNLQVDAESSPKEDTQDSEPKPSVAHEPIVAPRTEDAHVEESIHTEETAEVPQLVLNTSEEITKLNNLPEETSSAHLTPQQREPHERPASPSWVASYSVSQQGSPLQEHAPLVEESTLAEEIGSKNQPPPVPLVVETPPEIEVHYDTPYESAEPSAAKEASVDKSEDEVQMEGVHKPPSIQVLVNDAETEVHEDVPPNTSLTLVDDVIEVQDRPKSPWTPSYSVTMQGPGTPGEEKELDSIEPLPQRALDINSAQNPDHGDLEAQAIIPEVVQKTLPVNPSIITEESKLPPVMALERELQEIQASIHSNENAVPVASMTVSATEQENFPSVETTEQKTKLSKLSFARLAPVNEVEGMDIEPATSETVSSPSTRSRLESTTSSRFFPGGWFSTTPKVVDEGRTSLEIAQGEFTPSKVTSPVSPAPHAGDVSDTPDDASATSVTTGHATDSDSDDDEPEPKRRWCVVM